MARDFLDGVGGRLGVVAELVGDALDGADHGRIRARSLQPLEDPARPWSPQERPVAHLIRDRCGGEGLLERFRAGVDPVQHRDLLEGHRFLVMEPPDGVDDGGDLGLLFRFGTRDRRRTRWPGRAEGLLEPAEPRPETVREIEDLRRRAVVLLETDDRRVREPSREAQQMLGRGAGEGVDRLVVVTYHAEVVARAEPPLEQPRLQRVHILELIHRERGEPRSDDIGGFRVVVEEPKSEAEHVLEVQPAHRSLAALVPVVDPNHQILRDGGRMVAELAEVPIRRDHPVLGPLDLTGELAPGEELVRRRQRVRQRGDERSFVVQDLGERLTRVRRPESRELRERGRVEGPGLDARHAERVESPLQLTSGLLGEGDREDLRCLERTAPDLAGDPTRDRGGLARSRAGHDGDRPAEREGGLTLRIVQSCEDALDIVHLAEASTELRPAWRRHTRLRCSSLSVMGT